MIMSISGIYSLTENVVNSTENSLSTGYVDIEIIDEATNKIYMPGDIVDLKSKVKNTGVEAYIRVNVDYKINNSSYSVDDNFNIDSSLWTKVGDYYYFNSIVNKDEIISVFDNFLIPTSVGNEAENKNVVVKLVVEAIQSKNFTQDYSSSNPWNNVEITRRVERSYSSSEDGSSVIVYENGADNYLTIRNGFFDTLGNLLPGDSLSEDIDIDNKSGREIGFYFATKFDGLTDEERLLLQSIKLNIKDRDNNILYDGILLSDKKLLKSYGIGQKDKLKVTVTLPDNLDNRFSTLVTKLIWSFTCDKFENGVPVNPNTGEYRLDMSIKVFVFSSIALIIVLILAKIDSLDREKKKEGI